MKYNGKNTHDYGDTMGKIIYITGGARSGKSSFAEQLAIKLNQKIAYIATSIPFDDEMRKRVKLHRERRPANWLTIEAYTDLDEQIDKVISEVDAFLLDCITVMTTNIMMDNIADFNSISDDESQSFEDQVNTQLDKLLAYCRNFDKTIIIVSNEVGMGIVPLYKSARLFRDVAGRANQKIAESADEVYLCVSGIPVKIK